MLETPLAENTLDNNQLNITVSNVNLENNKKETISLDENASSHNNLPEPNCLALTVRKDYNLVIVKNIFTATGRLSWKIILSTVVLNFLRMMF